ncbi:hypothetical protein PVAND_012400 [Polypedilum vanderplanki]|uniref:REST corepressor n=1 Tax=Polypedilum vanderplanki TaxID=319348 RepID=A0A9J6CLH2_POLVA|nr:hypothetical protein PVAND_012400 [Polypedilum vanderplanki]
MTMSSEGKEAIKSNGTKSERTTSPLSTSSAKHQTSDLTPDTSDDDFQSRKNMNKPNKPKSEFEEKIRVGKDYQVVVPEMNPHLKLENYNDKALLVWSPVKDISEERLDEYIVLAQQKYGYNAEQALGMLFWHKHDLQKAVMDLQNFTPFPDEWTKEDKILFEQAYQFHGKCFHRIRQMLPDKSIASLVKFYYSWKKARTRSSTERQEKRKHEENGSENGSPNDSDIEEKNDSEIGDIEEIIGIPTKDSSDQKSNKTSIMTTSNKSLKRKHEDESYNINDDVAAEKKLATEKLLNDKPELTITLAKD